MAKVTLRQKLLSEYKNVAWGMGYWQRRLELASTADQEEYCADGVERNERLKSGLERALTLAKVSTNGGNDFYESYSQGYDHANACYNNQLTN